MTEENKTNMGFGYGGYGFGPMGGMMGPGMMGGGGMMGGYGYRSSIVSLFVPLLFLAVALFGLYIIYDALKRS